jgi:hypothetical protein
LASGVCRLHTPAFRSALFSNRRLATAGSEALGRWELPPPHHRFPLRLVCLADGSLPRAAKRLVGGSCNSHIPAFRCAWFVLQTARYRGQRSYWQVGATAPTPPLSAELGLSSRRLATTGSAALGRWELPPPHPRFPLRLVYLADGSLPRAAKRLAGGSYRPHTPAFRRA